jgi:hypothetical protein
MSFPDWPGSPRESLSQHAHRDRLMPQNPLTDLILIRATRVRTCPVNAQIGGLAVSDASFQASAQRPVVELVAEIAAIHLLAGCQAADLRGPHLLGHGTRAGYELIREHVPFVNQDRRLDGDLHTVVELIRSGTMPSAIRPHLGTGEAA